MKTNIKRTRTAIAIMIAGASLTGQSAMADYTSLITGSSPAAYWSFNEANGTTTTADISGNGFLMTYMNPDTASTTIPAFNAAITTVPGVAGCVTTAGNKATYFNGNLSAASNTVLGAATTRPLNDLSPGPSVLNWPDFFSIEAWVKNESVSTAALGAGADNATSRQIICADTMWGFNIENGRLHFVTFGKKDYFAPTNPIDPGYAGGYTLDDQWHQLGVVWEGNKDGSGLSRATFYLDGVNVGYEDSTAGNAGLRAETNLDMATIGRRRADSNNQQWLGYIDEVVVWHAVRTDADFAATYAAGKAPAATYYTWVEGFDTPPSPTADGDGDGLKNAVEYVLGTNPSVPNPGGPVPTTDLSSLIVSFDRSTISNTSDTTVFMDVSTDLANWTPYQVGVATEITVDPPVDGKEHTTLTLERGADPIKFARLRVEVTGP